MQNENSLVSDDTFTTKKICHSFTKGQTWSGSAKIFFHFLNAVGYVWPFIAMTQIKWWFLMGLNCSQFSMNMECQCFSKHCTWQNDSLQFLLIFSVSMFGFICNLRSSQKSKIKLNWQSRLTLRMQQALFGNFSVCHFSMNIPHFLTSQSRCLIICNQQNLKLGFLGVCDIFTTHCVQIWTKWMHWWHWWRHF